MEVERIVAWHLVVVWRQLVVVGQMGCGSRTSCVVPHPFPTCPKRDCRKWKSQNHPRKKSQKRAWSLRQSHRKGSKIQKRRSKIRWTYQSKQSVGTGVVLSIGIVVEAVVGRRSSSNGR